ncbi:odorant receptor 4-like [Temnothorax americanus]|uniref:odorant receptor 4-like n=1 Tax=Temnothorax americanus TaxID=1964332 RepID=UPI0040677734
MTGKRWNDDVAYVFSTQRVFLRVYGLWPLETQTVFTKIRWGACMIAQFLILPFIIIHLFWGSKDAGSNIECVTYLVSTTIAIVKGLCLTVSKKKLATNINAAIDDWISAKDNKETKKIMKKHADRSRILTLTLLYSLLICCGAYIAVVIFINLKILFTDKNLVDVNTTNWLPMYPSGPLGNLVTGSQFAILLPIQIVQITILSALLCIADCFFFNITIHLTGQLELLKNKFKTFANEPDTEANYRKKFVGLINRHSELMELYENLEDSFHFLILSQLVVTTIMLAMIGLRLNIYLNEKNYIEATKSVLVLNYLLMQSLVFTYGGEYLQKESEGIFHALYTTSWFRLPLTLMKDLHFAMMRSSIPFRLTGGKFFFVNRETMMYIFKTSASYISVLRIAIRKSYSQ